MTQKGRHAVACNAELNHLTEKVEIRGIVDDRILESFGRNRCVAKTDPNSL